MSEPRRSDVLPDDALRVEAVVDPSCPGWNLLWIRKHSVLKAERKRRTVRVIRRPEESCRGGQAIFYCIRTGRFRCPLSNCTVRGRPGTGVLPDQAELRNQTFLNDISFLEISIHVPRYGFWYAFRDCPLWEAVEG